MARLLAAVLPIVLAAVLVLSLVFSAPGIWADSGAWSSNERKLIGSLSIDTLTPLPPDPSNRVADNPAAAKLGAALFEDTRLSGNGQVSCATCHLPGQQFQDGLALAKGVGTTTRRTMPIAGTAYAPFLFWDGRKDSQWAQALGPLESAVEHGSDRTALVQLVAANHRDAYEGVFGPLPDLSALPPHAAPAGTPEAVAAWAAMDAADQDSVNRIFANIGKAIAAFERGIMPGESRFDVYARRIAGGEDATGILSAEEVAGLKLFVGKGSCINCHNGPLLTDNHFHNTGIPAVPGLPADDGRASGAIKVKTDPFNCLGAYSDAAPEQCAELKFMTAEGEELIRAYKPPSLRNVAGRAPYMHAGQFETLAQVLQHYNEAPAAPTGHSELKPLGLTADDLAALEAFLQSLSEAAT